MLWFSVPQMQSPGNFRIAIQKNLSPKKNTVFVSFMVDSFLVIFSNVSEQSPESVTKAALENLRKFLKKTSVGIYFF